MPTNMSNLCRHLGACIVATDALGAAKVNRETWENHPWLKYDPTSLIWFAMAVGVDTRWIGAAVLWYNSVTDNVHNRLGKHEVKRIAEWTRQPKGTPFRHIPEATDSGLFSAFGSWIRSDGSRFYINDLACNMYTYDVESLHAAFLKVLTWDIIKDAMVQNGLGEYLDE